jgi:hypothetical protein
MKRLLSIFILCLLAAGTSAFAQDFDASRLLLPDEDTMLLTVFLKHDQSMNNVQRGELLRSTGFNEMFPPDGIEIVDHYVMMGIGQVIVLRLPPNRLRELNVIIERGAWGAYQTEFYITYDLAKAREFGEQQENKEQ